MMISDEYKHWGGSRWGKTNTQQNACYSCLYSSIIHTHITSIKQDFFCSSIHKAPRWSALVIPSISNSRVSKKKKMRWQISLFDSLVEYYSVCLRGFYSVDSARQKMARKRSVLEGISKPLVGNHKKARHFTQEEHKAISAGFKSGGCLAIEEDCYEIPVQTLHVISDKPLSSLITICHSFPHRQRRGSTLRWPISLTDVSRKWKEIQPLPQQACLWRKLQHCYVTACCPSPSLLSAITPVAAAHATAQLLGT